MDKIKGMFKNLSKNKSLRYGSNSIILIAIVVAIAVMVNVLVGMADVKWDLTPNKLFSMGDTSKEILKGLKKDVVIYGLFDDEKVNSDYKEVTELLKQYDKYDHISVQYKDPDKNPTIINEIDENNLKKLQKNDFVVKSGSKLKVVSYYDLFDYQYTQDMQQQKVGSKAEQALTGAIKYVIAEKTPTIYFTEGHEEDKVDSKFTMAKEYMEKNNYEVKPVNLLTAEKVPDDAEILVVLAPKKDLSVQEADKIKDYFKNGGKAIFMFDPMENNTELAQFDKVLNDFNVALNYDKVKENDDNRHPKNDFYTIVPSVQSNSINNELGSDDFVMVMPKSRSINILKNQKEYITVTSLAKSSGKAVGEQIDKSKGADIAGPLDLAVAVENKGGAKVSKIIVIGNSSFMSDETVQRYMPNGLGFFLNAMNWMQDKKDDTMIQPKNYETKSLQMTAAQANISAFVVIILFPLLILGLGTFVWLRRRHL